MVCDLAVAGGQVAVAKKKSWQGDSSRNKLRVSPICLLIIVNAGSRAVDAGQQRGARRSATGSVAIAVCKPRAARRQPPDVGRRHRARLVDVGEIERVIV